MSKSHAPRSARQVPFCEPLEGRRLMSVTLGDDVASSGVIPVDQGVFVSHAVSDGADGGAGTPDDGAGDLTIDDGSTGGPIDPSAFDNGGDGPIMYSFNAGATSTPHVKHVRHGRHLAHSRHAAHAKRLSHHRG